MLTCMELFNELKQKWPNYGYKVHVHQLGTCNVQLKLVIFIEESVNFRYKLLTSILIEANQI